MFQCLFESEGAYGTPPATFSASFPGVYLSLFRPKRLFFLSPMQIATLLAKERTNHIANGVPFIVPAQVIFLNNTFARASIATRVNAQGLVEVVPPDTPRFDHDPVPLALKCLLLEVSRINISNQLSPWTQAGVI